MVEILEIQKKKVAFLLSEFPMTHPNEISPEMKNCFQPNFFKEILGKIDSHEELTPEAEDFLYDVAFDFLKNMVRDSCIMAQNRKAPVENGKRYLQPKDIYFILQNNYGMDLPGPYNSKSSNDDTKGRPQLNSPTKDYMEKYNAVLQYLSSKANVDN